jgi:thioredoxin-related protein
MLLANHAVASAGRDPYVHFFNESWGDFSEELAKAKEQGKTGVLLFFEMDECPFCHRMKQTVLNQPEVQEYFRQHFLSFAVDIEGDVEITDFEGNHLTQKEFATKINRVRATPVFAFYDLEGQQVVRYTGATTGVEEFLWLGEFFVSGEYKNMKFTAYKRMKKKGDNQ